MDDLLQRLEWQIKKLIEKQRQLDHSNQQLHQLKKSLAHEKAGLVAKQLKAIRQIENLVNHLKTIEKSS